MGGILGQLIARPAAWFRSRRERKAPAPSAVSAASAPQAAKPVSNRLYAVGIDLGTTLSAAAYISDTGQTTMVRNSEGDILTPSAVFFDCDKIVVGKRARAATGTQPDAVAEYAKRDMGNKTYSRPILGKRMPPEVIQAY